MKTTITRNKSIRLTESIDFLHFFSVLFIMLANFKRSIYALSNRIRQKIFRGKYESSPEGKFTIDFAKTKKNPFDIKSDLSYIANQSDNSFEMGLKKSNYIAWVEIPHPEYQDMLIEARIRLDSFDGYAAAGIIFRIMDETSYYIALVSSKGYFRLDVVKDSAPRPLIAWTEISDTVHSDFDGSNINLKIIVYGVNLIFLVNGKWLGEVNNDSIASGLVGFALASYPDGSEQTTESREFSCKAYLDFLSVDTQAKRIEEEFLKWTDDSNINAEARLRLAETFAVMGEASNALEQINKAWKRRDEAISSATIAYTEVRTRKELLLAARISFHLGQYSEAQEYIDKIFEQESDSANPGSTEIKLAYTEKLKILNELNKFAELKEFILKYPQKISKDLDYYILTARCYWELKEYKESAEAWDKAFELNGENGVYAANAASAYEFADNIKIALKRYIDAGKIFLNQDNRAELAALMPKLSALGSDNWEARALAGKWAFSSEDYGKSAEEFAIAEKLRTAAKPRQKADSALYYLWALVLSQKGKNKDAINLLQKAVKLAPDYGLFRFKLAEIKLKSGINEPDIAEEFKLALKSIGDQPSVDGISADYLAEYAGSLLLNTGDAKNAKYFFELAKAKSN